ncbi:hypothetical protein ACTWJ9_33205 (plasmid) [Streptomyces sp. GDS52]|uniref:hypothetical protein n=1 Tax=Streptomyces sp. GDS52 TaxID=3406419 RepID=UPI003FD09A4C
MRRIRPHLHLTAYALTGAAAGTGSVLLWLRLLGPDRPRWLLMLIAGATALLVLRVAAEVQHRHGSRRPRRAHARPHHAGRTTT